jgi:hypothetical protein
LVQTVQVTTLHFRLADRGRAIHYRSRILRLALLAPDLIEAILAGSADESLLLERLERPLPASWEEQRKALRARGRRGDKQA